MPRDVPENVLIAIVDDDASIRRAMERLMRAVGYRVVSYASGADFLDSLNHNQPACVVMDLHMTGVNRFDLVPRLQIGSRRIPLIVVTADDSPQLPADVIALGATVCLNKPVDDTVLFDAISVALQTIQVASHRA